MLTALVRTVKHDPNLSNDEVDGTATAVEEDIFRRAAPQVRAFAILLQATLAQSQGTKSEPEAHAESQPSSATHTRSTPPIADDSTGEPAVSPEHAVLCAW